MSSTELDSSHRCLFFNRILLAQKLYVQKETLPLLSHQGNTSIVPSTFCSYPSSELDSSFICLFFIHTNLKFSMFIFFESLIHIILKASSELDLTCLFFYCSHIESVKCCMFMSYEALLYSILV